MKRIATGAKKFLRKNNPGLVKARVPRRHYMYRFNLSGYGTVSAYKILEGENCYIHFKPRKWTGGIGWDFDRQSFHMYSCRKEGTWRHFPWQWSYKSYGYCFDKPIQRRNFLQSKKCFNSR